MPSNPTTLSAPAPSFFGLPRLRMTARPALRSLLALLLQVQVCAVEITLLPGLHIGRAAHTITPLRDGRFLVAGGFTTQPNPLPEAEVFQPATRTFLLAGRMIAPRYGHTASLLPDGTVLLAGGWDAAGARLASVELFDPATGDFRALATMSEARAGHIAVPLADGRVLFLGGVGERAQFLATAETYDPRTGRFARVGSMAVARENHAAVRLADGRVLVSGGHVGRRAGQRILDSAELFDPATDRFIPTGRLGFARHKHDAVLLRDGRVLITGGASREDDANGTTEFYDPATATFLPGPALTRERFKHFGTSVALGDGSALILGGAAGAERYRPEPDRFEPLPEIRLDDSESYAVAARSPAGAILLAGGYGTDIRGSRAAWLIIPSSPNTRDATPP